MSSGFVEMRQSTELKILFKKFLKKSQTFYICILKIPSSHLKSQKMFVTNTNTYELQNFFVHAFPIQHTVRLCYFYHLTLFQQAPWLVVLWFG